MQHRAILGCFLAAAFCASVSCSSNGGDTIPGYGLPCATIADCAQYSLKCGPSDKCVQCVDNAACSSDQVCQSGLCKTLQECQVQKDCKTGVCDEDKNLCVQCVLSSDCSSTQGCIDEECVERKPCVATSDCSKMGLVCDTKAGVCVTCRSTADCGVHRVCEDHDCVPEPKDPGAAGAGGDSTEGGVDSGGTAGVSGNAGRAGSGGKGGSGGVGAGGTGGTGGAGGKGGNGGTGGASACNACLVTETCTTDMRCVSQKLIDDLEDCNSQILAIEGRQGDWFAEADTGITQGYGYNDPGISGVPVGWTDHTCAAWTTGTPMGNTNQTFIRTGFELAAGQVYDLSLYTGLQIKLEASVGVQVVLRTMAGGLFGVTLGSIPNSNLRTAPFASMKALAGSAETLPIKLDTVIRVEFWAADPKASFDAAIHRVELY